MVSRHIVAPEDEHSSIIQETAQWCIWLLPPETTILWNKLVSASSHSKNILEDQLYFAKQYIHSLSSSNQAGIFKSEMLTLLATLLIINCITKAEQYAVSFTVMILLH